MMLDHLGEKKAAAELMLALEKLTEDGRVMPQDLNGKPVQGKLRIGY